MGAMYAVSYLGVAVAAQADLLEINLNSARSLTVHAVYVGQTSDVGDASSENLTLELIRGYNTSGSGGGAPDIASLSSGNTNTFSAESNNTTLASTGSPVALHREVWNTQIPFQYRPTPEERPTIIGGTRLVLRMSAPADSITITVTMIVEEHGS